MNVCLVSQEYPPETGWGGIGTYTRHLAQGLASRGHQVTVVSRSVTAREVPLTYDGGVRVTRIVPRRFPVRGRRMVGRFIRCLEYSSGVARALSRLDDFDIIEFPNWNAEGFRYLLGNRRAPIVTRVHSPLAEIIRSFEWTLTVDLWLAMWLERAAVLRSDLIVTHSHHNAETAARVYGLSAAGIPVIPHGVPIPPEAPPREVHDPPRMLYVGRLERRKGVHVLLAALPIALDAISDVEITIVGQDSPTAPGRRTWQEHALKTLSPTHQRRVHFLGHVDGETINRLYTECDLFVAPSLYESFGLVYLEAMAQGCAVIGSCSSAIPEVVADGETGLLVPPGDIPALAGAMISLLRDRSELVEMGRRGRERVKRLFNEQTMVDRVVELYEQIIRSHRQ